MIADCGGDMGELVKGVCNRQNISERWAGTGCSKCLIRKRTCNHTCNLIHLGCQLGYFIWRRLGSMSIHNSKMISGGKKLWPYKSCSHEAGYPP
jgi:hypothetical protein